MQRRNSCPLKKQLYYQRFKTLDKQNAANMYILENHAGDVTKSVVNPSGIPIQQETSEAYTTAVCNKKIRTLRGKNKICPKFTPIPIKNTAVCTRVYKLRYFLLE
jgi:hypothetical protein